MTAARCSRFSRPAAPPYFDDHISRFRRPLLPNNAIATGSGRDLRYVAASSRRNLERNKLDSNARRPRLLSLPFQPRQFRPLVSRCPCRKQARLTLAPPHDPRAPARVSFLRCAIFRVTSTFDSCSLCPMTPLRSRPFRSFIAPYLASQARSTSALFAP